MNYDLKLLFESSLNGFAQLDQEFKFVWVNKAIVELLGYNEKELSGNLVLKLIAPESRNTWSEFSEKLAAGISNKGDIIFNTKKGKKIHADFHAWPLETGYMSSMSVNENQQYLLESISLSEIKYRTLFETMAQGVIYQDHTGKIISANPAAQRILGMTENELLNENTFENSWNLVDDDGTNIPGILHPANVAFKTGKPVNNIAVGLYNTNKNDYIWMLVNSYPHYKTGENRPYMICTTLTDITERKQVEIELRKFSEEVASLNEEYLTQNEVISQKNEELEIKNNFLSLLIESIPYPLFYKDKHGRYQMVNSAFCRINDLPKEHFLGRTVLECIEDKELAAIYQKADIELLANKISQVYESKIRQSEDNYIDVIFNKSVLQNQKNEIIGIIGFIIDISEYKNTQTKLNLLNTALVEKNNEQEALLKKLSESDHLKSVFLANISHEIRTPMNGIIGFSDLLKDESLPADIKRQYIYLISKNSEQLLHLINDLIDISKIESNQLHINRHDCSLNALISELYLFFENDKKVKNKAHLQLLTHKDLPDKESIVLTDEARVHQILANIISNAIKYTDSGYVKFGYKLIGECIEFFVEDTGIGIDKDMHQLIFKRFRQVDENYSSRKYGGTGLGLTISEGLVKLLGGTIEIESEKNNGSIFRIKFPYIPSKEIYSSTSISKGFNIPDLRDKNIMIVEDDDTTMEFLISVFIPTKATLYKARTGSEAIEICMGQTKIDLILMDIRLPDISGFEVTRQIKQIKSYIPIIAQTAYAMAEDKLKCYESGCDDYISKPINIRLLFSIIKQHLGLN